MCIYNYYIKKHSNKNKNRRYGKQQVAVRILEAIASTLTCLSWLILVHFMKGLSSSRKAIRWIGNVQTLFSPRNNHSIPVPCKKQFGN